MLICRRACPLLVDCMRSFSSVLGNTGPNSTFWEVLSQALPCDIPRSPDKTAQLRLRPSSCQDKSHLPTFHPHPSSYKDKISQTRQVFKICYIVLSGKICFQTSILFEEKSYNWIELLLSGAHHPWAPACIKTLLQTRGNTFLWYYLLWSKQRS